MSQRRLDHLGTDDCFALLSQQEVGRLVYVDDKGPAAVPVNYAIDAGRVVFRVEYGSKRFALDRPVAFEVDHIDGNDQTGWSVLLRGRAQELPMEQVVELLHRVKASFPHPWAEGVHNDWLLLLPSEVTGRRLGKPVDEG